MSVNVKEIISKIEANIEEPLKALKKYELKEKNANYYEKNKEKVNAYNKEQISCCLCDKVLKRGSLRSHQKSKLCIHLCDLKMRMQKITSIENVKPDNKIKEAIKSNKIDKLIRKEDLINEPTLSRLRINPKKKIL